jgi:hypothetical protein
MKEIQMTFDTHYKKTLGNDSSYTVTTLESEVKAQFNFLNNTTFDELSQTEEPFLGVTTSDDPSFKFEVTLTYGGPNVFLFVDENGGFRIEGHSFSCSSVTMVGHNKELLNYFNQITGE